MKSNSTKISGLLICLTIIGGILATGCGSVAASMTPFETTVNSTASQNTINTPESAKNPEAPALTTISADSPKFANIMATASRNNKYVFAVFFKQNDSLSEEMKIIVSSTQKELMTKADAAYIDIADPGEKALIDKYGLSKAPIPITLIFAPNEALIKAFPKLNGPEDLKNAFVSPKMAEIIKSTQDQKLVYLYIANSSLSYYQENLDVMREAAEVDYQGTVNIIEIDPTDKNEAGLISQCQITLPITETNLLIVNGGTIVGKLSGKFDKPTLISTTTSSCSGGSCCGG